jgi:hypothetical protein
MERNNSQKMFQIVKNFVTKSRNILNKKLKFIIKLL